MLNPCYYLIRCDSINEAHLRARCIRNNRQTVFSYTPGALKLFVQRNFLQGSIYAMSAVKLYDIYAKLAGTRGNMRQFSFQSEGKYSSLQIVAGLFRSDSRCAFNETCK